LNSFGARTTLKVDGKEHTIYRLDALEQHGYKVKRLPYSLRILLENLLRNEGRGGVTTADIQALAAWDPDEEPRSEIAFTPARVLLQDFTGVPCVVDLAAMRDAMARLGGDPKKINPLQPVELVIDHSVQVDAYGSEAAIIINRDLEFERNQERYQFLKWGQQAFDNFAAVPPNTGIVHQVNLEYLARVVMTSDGRAYPDTLVGTDSHTTMVNGLGVLGWGVGGIEAEAAMLGQPISMLIPQVVGFRFSGSLPEGATATDLVLTVTEMLRKKGVVGKFVEFYGKGLSQLSLADRATIGNMAPEYGATCGIFPVDRETIHYLRMSGRSEEQCQLVEAYMRTQGLWHDEETEAPEYSETLHLDLSEVEPSVAGPRRPQDRVPVGKAYASFKNHFGDLIEIQPRTDTGGTAASHATAQQAAEAATAVMEKEFPADVDMDDAAKSLKHGDIVIAAITSCTNTSNPSVMLGAGLVARKAIEKGLKTKPWVKTSLAPGSRVVTEYLRESGLLRYLEDLDFHVVGYGCTTCIGNSGPLPEPISDAIHERDLVVCSVLSGNRNFEGRINPDIKANYLMSPMLVVAYALVGTIETDIQKDPIGYDQLDQPVYLKDIWPTQEEIAKTVEKYIQAEMFRKNYAQVFDGDEKWREIQVTGSDLFEWSDDSTYIKNPPYFENMKPEAPDHIEDLVGLRALAVLGDSVTTDHISPAGAIKLNSPAGHYLTEKGVRPHLFNSYGSRRGNHEIMMRGTFANIRLRNKLAPGTEGGFTLYHPTGEITTIYDASVHYRNEGIPLVVLAGKEYGTGSSRDWAAKGTALLGVKAVIAESYERIHRSNLVGMGVLPLQFVKGQGVDTLGLTGKEVFEVVGLREAIDTEFADGKDLIVHATDEHGKTMEFKVRVRIDTPQELKYYRHGGILHFVLRQLLGSA
jgi:aconitate hydratase